MATNTFKNAGAPITTGGTVLYTCPSSTEAIIHALYLSNINGVSPVNVDIQIETRPQGSSTKAYRYIGKTLVVPEDSSLVPDKPINLQAGDSIKITASSNSMLEAVASILEIT
jgi:hypothetical protein